MVPRTEWYGVYFSHFSAMIEIMIREILRDEIKKAIKKLFNKEVDFNIDSGGIYADYSSNIAMILGGDQRDNAEKIKKELLSSKDFNKYFSKMEIAGSGFLNFWLSEKGFSEGLAFVSYRRQLLNWKKEKKEKISLDYLDANPTGPVHLGHARSGFYGDVLANILEFYGHKVSREFYVNNAKSGRQIQSLGKTALGLGEEYKHEQLLDILKNPEIQKKLNRIKKEAGLPAEALPVRQAGSAKAGYYIAGLIQGENEKFLKNIAKIKFDLFFEEENIYSSGAVEKILEKLKTAGATYEKDGALWLKSSQYGDTEDRVLVRSTGEPTYLVPDINYHLDRLVKRKYDKAINIFGADHFGYGPRLKAALSALGISQDRVNIIIYQIVRLVKDGKEFKMSKREGVFATLEELIKEVGLDAARFFFLMHSIGSHMDFDLDLAKERSKKNPVYYVQYAHARARSILRKSNLRRQVDFEFLIPKIFALQKFCAPTPIIQNSPDGSERNLILKLIQFSEIIEDITENYQVHRLTTYAHELAKTFTDFYENVRVLDAETDELKKSRLALVFASRKILEKTLSLMGISAPERM